MAKTTYEQAFADHAYLWDIAQRHGQYDGDYEQDDE